MNDIELVSGNIKLILNNVIEDAEFSYSTEGVCYLSIKLRNGLELSSNDDDVFSCLCNIRNDNSGIIFLCKGAKENVYLSNMSKQMARGVVAYEYKQSEPARADCIVNIFDFEDQNVAITPKKQKDNYRKWIESLR